MSAEKHDVFVSFRGADTRLNFVSHLDAALSQKGIKTFIADFLARGEEISTNLLQRIEESTIALVVLSENYATSTWCLDELVHVLKCRQERAQIVVPIFYGVSPLDVRKQRGSYGYAFREHEGRYGHETDRLSKWRAALKEVANISGWTSDGWKESKLIEMIVNDVFNKLTRVPSSVTLDTERLVEEENQLDTERLVGADNQLDTERLVGVDNQLEQIESADNQLTHAPSSFTLDTERLVENQLDTERLDGVDNPLEQIESTHSQFTCGCRFLKVILGVLSAIVGLIFVSQSSFFKLQFDNTKTSEILFFGIVSALLVFLVSMAPNWGNVLHDMWNLNVSKKLAIECVFMGIVWMLSFLIKYPQFNVRSKDHNSCVFENQGKKVSHESQYTLFSVGAFAFLAVVLASEGKKKVELGFFSILIGLIMDTSMEIDGPNAWYVFGSVFFCIGLILFKHYIESSTKSSVVPVLSTINKRQSLREAHRDILVIFSALVGNVFLFLSPFSKQQFKDSTDLKGTCFITFSHVLGLLLLKARKFIDVLATKCHKQYLVKATVRTFLFAFLSGIMFLTKYPRFKLHSELKEYCKERQQQELNSQRNQYDVFSAASFSLFALVISSGEEQPVKLGIFSFLLELTMDSSIELLGKDEPNFFYLIFSFVYCATLIFVKSYLDSSIKKKDDSVCKEESYQENPNARDMSFADDRPLNGTGDIEMGNV